MLLSGITASVLVVPKLRQYCFNEQAIATYRTQPRPSALICANWTPRRAAFAPGRGAPAAPHAPRRLGGTAPGRAGRAERAVPLNTVTQKALQRRRLTPTAQGDGAEPCAGRDRAALRPCGQWQPAGPRGGAGGRRPAAERGRGLGVGVLWAVAAGRCSPRTVTNRAGVWRRPARPFPPSPAEGLLFALTASRPGPEAPGGCGLSPAGGPLREEER